MTFDVDKDLALLYGIMLGDGCLSLVGRKKFITITGSLEDDLPFFIEVISGLLVKFRGKETNIKLRKDCNAVEFNFTDKNLFDFLHSLGFPIGKKLDKLSIPKIFYDRNLVEHVINGFFATDGSLVLTKNPNKYYPRLEANVISKTLLFEIYNYLLKLGMNGGFYLSKSKPDPRWRISQDKYRFQFNGMQNLVKFHELIGFSNPKYEQKFRDFIKYSDNYHIKTRKISFPMPQLSLKN